MHSRTSQLQMAFKSNGLQSAVNMTVGGSRSSNISMSAGFGPSGAPLRRLGSNVNSNESEFTITNFDDKVEKPWGYKR